LLAEESPYSPSTPGDDRMVDDSVRMMIDGDELEQVSGQAPQWAPGRGVRGALVVPSDELPSETPSWDCQICSKENTITEADKNFIYQLARDLGADAERSVSEIYSPPRVTAAAQKLKWLHVLPGFALDLSTTDEDGVA
jgi:hypothetical protein